MPKLNKNNPVKDSKKNMDNIFTPKEESKNPSKRKSPPQKIFSLFSALAFIVSALFLLGFCAMLTTDIGVSIFCLVISVIMGASGILLRRQGKDVYIDTQKVENLEKEVQEEKAKYTEMLERKKTLADMKDDELEAYFREKEAEKSKLEATIKELEKVLLSTKEKTAEAKKELLSFEDDLLVESFGLYKPRYDFANSLTYQTELNNIRDQQKKLIKDGNATTKPPAWTIDGDEKAGKKLMDEARKLMLRAFNNECEAAINKIRAKNIDVIKRRITKSYEDINKLNQMNQFRITSEYFDLKISELHLAYEYELKKEEEREVLREQREKEREERALQREVDKKKKSIEKELVHLDNALVELENKLLLAKEDERTGLEEQINETKNHINKFKDEQKDLDYRLEHTGAGYVYVISNIGSFGEDIFKIGVTRRLDPMDRVRELGSASVPFQFDVHALIFSYEAYTLEAELHHRFAEKRVNLVNNRKEFFKLNGSEIKSILDQHKELTFEFKDNPEAEEYYETLALRKAQ